jgi:hypothetical protein
MSTIPILNAVRIIPRDEEFLNRKLGSRGEIFYDRDSNSLRLYDGQLAGGISLAKADLTNIPNAIFLAKATAAGVGSGGNNSESGASISVSATAPEDAESGNLWFNSVNGYLYVYIDDGSSEQWVQPGLPIATLAPVAFTGDYDDLVNVPEITEVDLTGYATETFVTTEIGNIPAVDLTGLAPINNPTFTGTVGGITSTMVGLGNVTNESKATMFTSPTFTGTTTLQQSTELLDTKTSATGTVVHDFSTSAIWYHSSISADFTANFTNVPTTNNRTVVGTLILVQGGAPFIPNAVQIAGTPQTINWLTGSEPAGTASAVDIVSFTLIRVSDSWTVLGSLSSYS